MKKFAIASPHKNKNWYDYRVYINLKSALESLGYIYEKNAPNRIYFLGAPLRDTYDDIELFERQANNIALIYCHSQSIHSLVNFNHVFVASQGMKRKTILRAIKRKLLLKPKYINNIFDIKTIYPFSSLTPSTSNDKKYSCDISFVGNIRKRPIVEDVLAIVKKHNLDFKIYGDDWNNYQGNPDAIKYWQGDVIPYEDIPLLAKNSKICLVDHHEEMNKEGTVSHKYIDLLMAKACLISDNNKGIGEFAGQSYKSLAQLEKIILKLTNNPEYREAQIERQYAIAKEYSTKTAAKKISSLFV